MQPPSIKQFRSTVKTYFKENGRDFPWRQTTDPYSILVSEVMLQQTQTYRVEPKYMAFMKVFPTFESLARAPFSEVLLLWKGLGYNRRALGLQSCAKIVMQEHSGVLPKDPIVLKTMPGIGAYTSCAVPTFAYNTPHSFIETNIRAVFIHHFFKDRAEVTDKEIMALVEKTVDTKEPRKWYYALMDYGVFIKQNYNPNKKSAHYTVQSKFEGSNRQVRGLILQALLDNQALSFDTLLSIVNRDNQQTSKALSQLVTDQLVEVKGEQIFLSK
ncbi:A/G-specific adenine glycosylase [bacterium]|jgi:A/G-specific adenine glycosylase|nr:A/G-specific adenine glycosylase [bacterium]MBT5015607.1 A/G-specific adenine glycosylase [bacterium]